MIFDVLGEKKSNKLDIFFIHFETWLMVIDNIFRKILKTGHLNLGK